jgi:dolichyl-phosphate-mannose-protein mannosyltransferase
MKIKKNKAIKYVRKYYLVIALVLLSLITRLVFLDKPGEVVFDEKHFGSFAGLYFTGEKYFDIHPPLGKLIIALGAFLSGYTDYVLLNGGFAFEDIYTVYPKGLPYVGFRLLPALAGSFIPLSVFLVARKIGINKNLSYTVGFILVFENFLIVQSRFILIDSFMILFGFMGILFFLKLRETDYRKMRWFALSFVMLAFSASVKWTGLMYMACCFFVLGFDFYKKKIDFKKTSTLILKTVFGGFFIYFFIFGLHFKLLPNHQTDQFEKRVNLDATQGAGLLKKFLHYHENMLRVNQELEMADHDYASRPIEWVNMEKVILFWEKESNDYVSKIVALGNPFNWWLGLIGAVVWIMFFKKIDLKREYRMFLVFSFLISYVPFFFITRVMFLYSYLTTFIFSILIFFALFQGVFRKWDKKTQKFVCIGLVLISLIFYLIYSPFSYGFKLKKEDSERRVNFLLHS